MDSRPNPGPANLRHHDAVIGSLRAAGFDMAMAAHAYDLVNSYIYGFAMTHMNLPFDPGTPGEVADVAETMLRPFPFDTYPNLAAFITEHAMKPGYDCGNEFEWGWTSCSKASSWLEMRRDVVPSAGEGDLVQAARPLRIHPLLAGQG